MVAVLFSACRRSKVPPEEYYKNGLVDFVYDIADNPDKLKNLKTHYLQFYNKDCLFFVLEDSTHLHKLITNIKLFTAIEEKTGIAYLGVYESDIKSMNIVAGTDYHFNSDQLYGIVLFKEENDVSIDFIFVRIDTSRFFIFSIISGIFRAH